MPVPLITKEMRECFVTSGVSLEKKTDLKELVPLMQKALHLLDALECRTLRYILLHLKRMASIKGT